MTYNYVHTTTEIIERGLNKQILRPYVKRYLYSLFNGFTNSNFGYNSLYNLSKNIKVFYDNLYPDEQLMIDSGGYSIITGLVNPRDVIKFIECYNYFLEYHQDIFHDIISLDIPIFLKYPMFNNVSTIKNNNYKSLSESKKVLDKYPELYEKFLFVWHFKIQKQFNIWRELYDELFADEPKLKHHSIGGLVSLRGITGIKFSPFIGPVYRILKLIDDNKTNKHSKIHILGVYGRHDRFMMQFMNILINQYYFKDKDKQVDIMFDTINYTISGLFKIRDFPLVELLKDNFHLSTQKEINSVLKKFIPNETVYNQVLMEIDNISQNKQITDTRLLSLTYVIYSHIIDQMMLQFIQEENLVELFIKYPNYNQLKNKLIPIISKGVKKYPAAFKNIERQFMSNFYWLSNFHLAFTNNYSIDRIDKGIELFIKHINFPGDLND